MGGICVFYDPFCMVYDNNGFCVKAAKGYSVTEMTMAQQSIYRTFIQAGYSITNSNSQVNYNSSAGGTYQTGGIITQYPYSGLTSIKYAAWNIYG